MGRRFNNFSRLFHLGEDADFGLSILDAMGLRPRDYVMGALGGSGAAIWRRVYDTNPLDLVIYGLSTLAIILALIALWRLLTGHRWQFTPHSAKQTDKTARTEPSPDIDARHAYFTILDGSEWREKQIRETTDTTNLVRNWLDVRLDEAIHRALFNGQLASWGEEVLSTGAMAPEGPIPVSAWRNIEIMFDRNSAPRTSANWKVRGIHQTGPIAWAGIKFSRKQFFELFPLGGESEWKPIHLGIQYVAEKIGDAENTASCLEETRRTLRQAAYEKRVKIRGKKQLANKRVFQEGDYSDIHTDVAFDYWVNSRINALATSPKFQDEKHTEPETAFAWGKLGVDERNYYAKLLINWPDLIREWP